MIDCYMSLTVPCNLTDLTNTLNNFKYFSKNVNVLLDAIELAHRIDREVPYGVKWIEEYFFLT